MHPPAPSRPATAGAGRANLPGEAMKRLIPMLALLLGLPIAAGAETVTGEACYRYGPAETFYAAKHVSISLAKRKALEGYPPFVEAAVNMNEPALRNELFANLTVRALRNLKLLRSEENAAKKEVCSAIEAEVEAADVKEQVAAVFNAYQRRTHPPKSWLPHNEFLRIVNIEEFACTFDPASQCLNVVAECLQESPRVRHPVRITWYDREGVPAFTIKRRVGCERARDVSAFLLRLPPPTYTFIVDLP